MATPNVFISHSGTSRDKAWLEQFVRSLQTKGLSVVIPQKDFRPGEDFTQETEKALRNSEIIVSLIDDEAVKRPNLFFELGAAVATGKLMIAVVPPNFDLSLLPDPLKDQSFILKRSPTETANALASMVERLQKGKAGKLSESELEKVAQHIINYLNGKGFNNVSFERIRERINPDYSDELLLLLIDKLPNKFRRVRLRGNRPGIGLVQQ